MIDLEHKTGATVSDLVLHYVRSPRMLLGVLGSASVLMVTICAAAWAFSHSQASPGTEVKLLWGMFSYHKAAPADASTSGRYAEKSKHLVWYLESGLEPKDGWDWGTTGTYDPIPLFDGTVSFWVWEDEIYVGGVNVAKLSIASRDGRAFNLEPRRTSRNAEGQRIQPRIVVKNCDGRCVAEITYSGVTQRISVEREQTKDEKAKRESTYATVERVSAKTMEATPYMLLKEF